MPFIVPCVPTGMNTGVSTSPCRSVITPTRAFVVLHFAITLYFKGGSEAGASFILIDPFVFEINDAIRIDILRKLAKSLSDEQLKNNHNAAFIHYELDSIWQLPKHYYLTSV